MKGHYKGHILHSRRYSRRNSKEKKVALILSTYLIQLDFFAFDFVNTIAQDGLCFYFSCCNQLLLRGWRLADLHMFVTVRVEKKVWWNQHDAICKVKVLGKDGKSECRGWGESCEEASVAWGSVVWEVNQGILLSLQFCSCQLWTPQPLCPIQNCKRLQGILLLTEDWSQGQATSFNVGVILGHGLQWFSKKFRRHPDKSNLFLHQLWYWLGPSGTKGSSLCSLPAFALPKAKRGDESQTWAETASPEATLALSITLTLISSTQLPFPGPLPHPFSSELTFGWKGRM